MYFNKYPYRSNFEFLKNGEITTRPGLLTGHFSAVDFQPKAATPYGSSEIKVTCQRYADDIYYLKVSSNKWTTNYAQSELKFPAPATTGQTSLEIDEQFNLSLKDHEGKPLLESFSGKGFGVSGNESIYTFNRLTADRYYGMGEKLFGMELSGRKTKFWNTDVFADFSLPAIEVGMTDPMYVAVPYLIIQRGGIYIGLLLDNPYATFIDTDGKINIAGQMDAEEQPKETLALGAEHGQPNLIIIYGPTLNELTCKLQKIVGVTPLPPAWALGYHQSRWGYKSYTDLKYIDAAMDKFAIPCDAIWLDIEYMRGYRVFTFEQDQNFPDLENNLKAIQANGGRRVIPIIDPGVKAEVGYEVYDSGHQADIFCKNPQGQEFIGLVWPGETVFPDFSTAQGRTWWIEQVKKFAGKGISGAWLDMNDPAVGSALCQDMLFNDGKDSHYTYHNQYGMGMARASRDGFALAHPNDRPFILSRSGFTGSSKYAAIWTGDNISNYHYLKYSISCTLNLALSGIPFNGSDAGGFAGDTNADLIVDWFKTGFLFPFFRNHNMFLGEAQEPWSFDKQTLTILRYFIRMRYRLRPYLYNLFAIHEESGAAILRPLFYEFSGSENLPLDRIDTQFMVGESIMQAPFVDEGAKTGEIILPAANWYSPLDYGWLEGNCRRQVTNEKLTTPIYFREGAIIPMAQEVTGDHTFNATEVQFQLFFRNNGSLTNEYIYIFDDGQSYDYRSGKRSRLKLTVTAENGELIINTQLIEDGYGDCQYDFAVYDEFSKVTINGKTVVPQPMSQNLAGCEINIFKLG